MNGPGPNQATPPRLGVVPWPDPALERYGHRPGSPYVEAVWVGVLGPSATWAWQRLARVAAAHPGASIDTVDLAVSLGLGEGLGPNATISRTLRRLVIFGLAQQGPETIALRLALPDVSVAQARRLSASARLVHERLGSRGARAATTEGQGASADLAEGVSL